MHQRFLHFVMVVLGAPLLAHAGPLVVDKGEFFVVPSNDQQVTGDVIVHGTFQNLGEVTHLGLFENFGVTDNQGLFSNFGEFRNFGLLTNSATFGGPGLLVNNGTIVNENQMTVSGGGDYVASGTWLNDSSLTFDAADVLVTGVVQNDGSRVSFAGNAEVAADATLEQRDLLTSVGGTLVNRGVTNVVAGALLANRVENHGEISVDAQLAAEVEYVQISGHTRVGQLVSPSVQVFGGIVSANDDFSDIRAIGGDTLVEIFDGTISGGSEKLHIDGGLVLYEDATMLINVGDDDVTSLSGDIALTGDLVLDGTLQIQFDPGTLIRPGDSWALAFAGGITGAFDEVILPAVPGIDFELFFADFLPGQLRLRAVAAPVPLPASLLLMLSSGAVLLRFRRQPRLTGW